MSGSNEDGGKLGRIALKQVRVTRQEAAAMNQGAQTGGAAAHAQEAKSKPVNRLVPYLDLFDRLDNDELSRLARVPTSVVDQLRKQVDEVNRALERYLDLLPRLRDEELVRLTRASAKTIRFWRLCNPAPRTESAPSVRPQPQPPTQRPDESGSAPQVSLSDSQVGLSAVEPHYDPATYSQVAPLPGPGAGYPMQPGMMGPPGGPGVMGPGMMGPPGGPGMMGPGMMGPPGGPGMMGPPGGPGMMGPGPGAPGMMGPPPGQGHLGHGPAMPAAGPPGGSGPSDSAVFPGFEDADEPPPEEIALGGFDEDEDEDEEGTSDPDFF